MDVALVQDNRSTNHNDSSIKREKSSNNDDKYNENNSFLTHYYVSATDFYPLHRDITDYLNMAKILKFNEKQVFESDNHDNNQRKVYSIESHNNLMKRIIKTQQSNMNNFLLYRKSLAIKFSNTESDHKQLTNLFSQCLKDSFLLTEAAPSDMYFYRYSWRYLIKIGKPLFSYNVIDMEKSVDNLYFEEGQVLEKKDDPRTSEEIELQQLETQLKSLGYMRESMMNETEFNQYTINPNQTWIILSAYDKLWVLHSKEEFRLYILHRINEILVRLTNSGRKTERELAESNRKSLPINYICFSLNDDQTEYLQKLKSGSLYNLSVYQLIHYLFDYTELLIRAASRPGLLITQIMIGSELYSFDRYTNMGLSQSLRRPLE